MSIRERILNKDIVIMGIEFHVDNNNDFSVCFLIK